jgi:DNA end-binding protein Ku
MARAIWSGAVSFGLVNVPVKAYTAVRDHKVHFHQLDKQSGSRIHYEKVAEKSGKEVAADDVELGYEIERGSYVTVDPDELDELRPKSTRSIDVVDFVNLDDVDPIYYQRTYWLAPDGQAAVRPYRLLLAAMEDTQRVGVGTVVMRNKQYLAAIRPLDGALAMSTMRFADEVVAQSAIEQLPDRSAKVEPKELKLATQIIDSLASEWDPERYHDTYTEELKDLIERKSKGEDIVREEAPAARSNVLDLMAALEASVAAAKKAGGGDVAKEVARTADRLAEEAEASSAWGRGGGPGGRADNAKKKAPARKGASKSSGAKSAGTKSSGTKSAAPRSAARKSTRPAASPKTEPGDKAAAKKAPARKSA